MIRAGARAFALKLLLTIFTIIAIDQIFRKQILSSPGIMSVFLAMFKQLTLDFLQMKL